MYWRVSEGTIMITFQLKKLLDERKITMYRLARDTGVSDRTIAGMYHNKIQRLDLPLLDKICRYLECQPGDIIIMQD